MILQNTIPADCQIQPNEGHQVQQIVLLDLDHLLVTLHVGETSDDSSVYLLCIPNEITVYDSAFPIHNGLRQTLSGIQLQRAVPFANEQAPITGQGQRAQPSDHVHAPSGDKFGVAQTMYPRLHLILHQLSYDEDSTRQQPERPVIKHIIPALGCFNSALRHERRFVAKSWAVHVLQRSCS